jgi:hypothetical protein
VSADHLVLTLVAGMFCAVRDHVDAGCLRHDTRNVYPRAIALENQANNIASRPTVRIFAASLSPSI